jgi:hypothetical protein
MSTSPITKPQSGKKNVPVKWHDNTWYPRIVIRSVAPRISARAVWGCDPRVLGFRESQYIRVRALDRPGAQLLNRGFRPLRSTANPLACSRFSSISTPRSRNSL